MPETRPTESVKKKIVRRLPAAVSVDSAYRPSYKPPASERSPFSTRPSEAPIVEDSVEYYSEEEVEEAGAELVIEQNAVRIERGNKKERVGREKTMARRGEESEMQMLLKLMMEREEARKEREEARYAEMREREVAANAEMKDREVATRTEMLDLFRQMRQD